MGYRAIPAREGEKDIRRSEVVCDLRGWGDAVRRVAYRQEPSGCLGHGSLVDSDRNPGRHAVGEWGGGSITGALGFHAPLEQGRTRSSSIGRPRSGAIPAHVASRSWLLIVARLHSLLADGDALRVSGRTASPGARARVLRNIAEFVVAGVESQREFPPIISIPRRGGSDDSAHALVLPKL